MLWKNRRQSHNVVDRRTMKGPVGIGALLVGALFYYLMGGNPVEYVAMNANQTQQRQEDPKISNEQKEFAAVVLADTEDVWSEIFASKGLQYEEPKLVLFSGSVASACGHAGNSVGPFYCPRDQQVYLDLTFFEELIHDIGAGGDFASAYVIAHEVGHHVQNLMGKMKDGSSVNIELQADCFAGVWARKTDEKKYMESGDLEEALDAASAVGDDNLQKRSGKEVVPDSFTHGSSEQRSTAFRRGFNRGEVNDCL